MPLYGKCTNVGLCNKASTNEILIIEDNKKFECHDCHLKLNICAPKEFNALQKILPASLVTLMLGIGGIWTMNSEAPSPKYKHSAATHPEMHSTEKTTTYAQATQEKPLIKSTTVTQLKPALRLSATAAKKPVITKTQLDSSLTPTKNSVYHTHKTDYKQLSVGEKSANTLQKNNKLSNEKPVILTAAKNIDLTIQHALKQKTAIKPILVQTDSPNKILSNPKAHHLHQHHPDNLQKQLALAKQNYLQPDKRKLSRINDTKISGPLQPIIDAQEAAARDRAANHLNLSRLGIELSGDALVEAAEKGNLRAVRLLIASGVPANIKNSHGQTALMASTKNGHKHIIKLLLKSKHLS